MSGGVNTRQRASGMIIKGVSFLARLADTRRPLLACAILASLILTMPSSLKATTIAPVQLSNWPAWNRFISHTPTPRAGCFEAAFPSTVWQPAQCATAPLIPLLPSTVGNGNDEVAESPSSTLIGSSSGSFQSISGLTSEVDSKAGADYYTLQDNTNFFTTSTPYTGNNSTRGWEQFVFANDGSSLGFVFIQYWLINYQKNYGGCPSTGPPNGSSWMEYSGSCYANSPGILAPSESGSNLANLILTGYANFGSNDQAILCISGGSCYTMAITPQVVNLYQYWQDAEFNVFGYGDGSEANFNSGTSIAVSNSLADQQGKAFVPSCVNTGYTAETNNLNLGSCSSNSNGQIIFPENSGIPITQNLITQIDAGSGSVSPNCAGSCPETVGLPVTVTATPSSGWQFSSWSTQAGIACFSNPCVFTMPNNAVTLGATFSQVTQATQTLTTNGVGSGSVSPNCPSGCQEQVGSSVTVTATPAANWQFSSWGVTGASCSGGSSSNLCAFTMPSNAVTVSATFTPTTYSVTLAESGIPEPGISWGVTVAGQHYSTSSSTSILVSGLSGVVSYLYDSPVAGTGGSYTCSGGGYSSCSGSVSGAGTITAAYTFNPTMQTLTTGVNSGSGSVSPNCPSGCSEAVGSSISITANPNSGWQFSGWSTQVGVSCSSNPCTFTMPNNGVTVLATFVPQQATMSVSYAIVGGGNPSAPKFNYIVGGMLKSLTLKSTSIGVTVDVGSSWSVTPSALGESSSSQRWYSTQPLTGRSSATIVVFVFYRQTWQILSYSVKGGGSGYSPSVFQANQFGSPTPFALTTKPTGYWFDYGSSWRLTPNPLPGSSASERWFTTQTTSGTIGGTSSRAFTYQHQFYLTMQINPSGPGSASPSNNWYNAAQKVTISATAKTGHKFLSWAGSGAGNYSGPSVSATITMNAPITETANFGVIITITSNPTGTGYVTVDGHSPVKTPLTFVWLTGSAHTIAAVSPVSCGIGCQYNFTNWSDGGSQSHPITVPSSPTTYKAIFHKQYLLTTTVTPSGTGVILPSPSSNGWYNAGVRVTLIVTANSGHTFKSWKGTGSGSYTGTNTSPTITMNAAITETADFT